MDVLDSEGNGNGLFWDRDAQVSTACVGSMGEGA